MITLNNEYQYIGRSSAVRAYSAYYYYYILLYAKAEELVETSQYAVSVKMRLVCDQPHTFYKYYTDGAVTVDGVSVISWNTELRPGAPWAGSSELTEDGVTYQKWVDLAEGTTLIDTDFLEKNITIDVSWLRCAMSTTPPYYAPRNVKATGSFVVSLPALYEEPDPEEPTAPTDPASQAVMVYADDDLVYDSRLEDFDLAGLKVTSGINVGGTAEITMPQLHPAYDRLVDYRTVVTVYRDGALRFRGRARYSKDNIYSQRTVTCEGERCFLRDGIIRPKTYKSTPAKIFRAAIREYNSQVDDFKQFTIGTVTIPDADIELEVGDLDTALDVIDALQDRCGGQVVFTSASNGRRVINWLEVIKRKSEQMILFGENLLQFTRTGEDTEDLATVLIPYGATNDETGKRLTIESVNDGKDYIVAEDARELRGTIMASEVWDDITDPEELLDVAKDHLNGRKNFITSLELTALDLSYIDKSLQAFNPGDIVRVISHPHRLDEYFQITKITEDLLDPSKSRITLGKELQSLTGAAINESKKTHSEVAAIGGAINTIDPAGITAAVERSVLTQTDGRYASQAQVTQLGQTDQTLLGRIATEESTRATADANLQTAISNEANARAGVINKVDGTVHISGGAPINMLGGKIDINGTEINFGKEARFLNESGIRIADKDGNSYYVLRVDSANSCVVGNDYTNLYLRGKDAVYLYKTGAVVTSDRRHKNSVEELPATYEMLLDKLTPVRFRYNGRGEQYHVGFVAQDVDAALTEAGLSRKDFGGFTEVAGDLGLAYDEFIGLLLQKVQRLEKRITELEGKS